MKQFAYIRCSVRKPDPAVVGILNMLVEKTTDRPQLDIVPAVFSGSLSFEHAFLSAATDDDAYARGPDLLPPLGADVICMNDYVVQLPAELG